MKELNTIEAQQVNGGGLFSIFTLVPMAIGLTAITGVGALAYKYQTLNPSVLADKAVEFVQSYRTGN
jgi:hypothetical protein